MATKTSKATTTRNRIKTAVADVNAEIEAPAPDPDVIPTDEALEVGPGPVRIEPVPTPPPVGADEPGLITPSADRQERRAPWTLLGRDVTGEKTARSAIERAGLDWTVRSERIVTESGIPVGGRRNRAIVREDRNVVLGVVGNRYQPIDNRTCFDFMDSVTGRPGGVEYETAGAIGDGQRIWLLARVDGLIRVANRDAVEKYLLLHNTHDGTGALRALFTGVRVVCVNTLNQALREGEGEGLTIRHSGDIMVKVNEAQRVLGLANTYFDDLAGRFDLMSRVRLTSDRRNAYFKRVFAPRTSGDDADAESAKWPGTLDILQGLAEAGRGQAEFPQIRGTVWAAYNAVTEYTDYHTPGKSVGLDPQQRASTRLDQIWFGPHSRRKSLALDLATALAESA